MTNLGFFFGAIGKKNMVFQYSDNLSICFCPEEVCQGTS